ncbi:Na+/H+ antiporter subunit E [Haloarchaeobius baliensis]|uniref:Na+/H+ antiporter subunit E n=1 Tax=Haloarchaeobius baliensis TaxID=1670458 RepID=UPI003F88106E
MTTLVVVLTDRGRIVDTVEYAVREAREAVSGTQPTVRFVVPAGEGTDALPWPTATDLAARVRTVLADGEFADLPVRVEVVTVLGESPGSRAASLAAQLETDDARVVLLPNLKEFDPAAMRVALDATERESVVVERAPVGRQVVRPPIALARSRRRQLATFGLALGFYLTLGDPTRPFDVATGLVSATVVTLVTGRLTFAAEPSVASLRRLARASVFVPYLLFAVVRANLAMAAVVLHPRLPIEPTVVSVPAPRSRLGRALLANSITLTPGTLTVDVESDALVVHTLTAASRADLEAGALTRAVAWVLDEERPEEQGPETPGTTAEGGA